MSIDLTLGHIHVYIIMEMLTSSMALYGSSFTTLHTIYLSAEWYGSHTVLGKVATAIQLSFIHILVVK